MSTPNQSPTEAEKTAQNANPTAIRGITAPTPPPPSAIVHAACGQWWTGTGKHHCSGCCRTFTSITAFTAHRDGSHARGERHCLDPVAVGLIDAGHAYPCWGIPGTDEHWASDTDGDAA